MNLKSSIRLIVLFAAMALLLPSLVAQETTGGLQGTVKDPAGAVVTHAQVTLTAASLVGTKTSETDGSGYYRFANLPPGSYTLTITAKGFSTYKREGLTIAVGHLPSVDVALEIGTSGTVVEVTGEPPAIDVTTNTSMTNITQDVVEDVPHGRSFQSIIQFAPSARNEPLMGSTTTNGTGGNAPGSTTNGGAFGFSIGGASDAENSYLVDGQETANLIGGYSHTNVPFDFIEEVQIKTSGVEAEHGGALGGVVNVISKKGSNNYHGSLFTQFENDKLDGSPNAYSRYDPLGNFLKPNSPGNTSNGYVDAASQNFQPIHPKSSDIFPGFTFGGPILKNRVFAFVAFNPEWIDRERTVNYGAPQILASTGLPKQFTGIKKFSRNQQTYYTTARVDGEVTQKVRLYASWLYQYQRESGVGLPDSDSTSGLLNNSTGCHGGATPDPNCLTDGIDPAVYAHSIGYKAPNVTFNTGVDYTINSRLVATGRFGYYFENYNDFGLPSSGTLFQWQTNGIGASDNQPIPQPLPQSLQQSQFFFNDANSSTFTRKNSNKAVQIDADLAWFKSGWGGTHNFKFGYQLNRLQNDILQSYNEPFIQLFVGNQGGSYSPLSPVGIAFCTGQDATKPYIQNSDGSCAGQFGTVNAFDFGTGGKVTSFNHGLFAQDSWTIGHGVTINAGLRLDKEYLPASTTAGLKSNPIDYSWGDKIAPRIGLAWDVFKDGRMKVFGGYGKFFDIMKLNVAISSFGGQYWNICTYTLDTSNLSSIAPALNSAGRYCVGDPSTGANWKGGTTPAGLTFIENINNRSFPTTCSTCSATSTGVVPGLKPYSQHDSVFGVDYEIRKNLAFEARWDRHRLDHVIEDSSLINQGNETFVIGNPGQGIESTFAGFNNFLYGAGATPCTDPLLCPVNNLFAAARSYDGLELRLTKGQSQHWFGMFSYTYSKLRGNYTGLTSSDISDGQSGGRSSPNNSRAFDEPYFQWNAQGGSSSGLLPTDRPHTFKGYAYYELGWLHKFTTDFGIFQVLYSGSPITSYLDVGAGNGGWAVQAWNRGKWVDVTRDATTGFLTVGSPRTRRTPWYSQSDFQLTQNFKISESKVLSFGATFSNLLNQRAVTAYNADITSLAVTNQYITLTTTAPNDPITGNPPCAFGHQCYIGDGNLFYAAAERPFDVQGQLNNFKSRGTSAALNSAYGTPVYYQLSRNIRLNLKFTF
jgi:hypothetical protein